MIDSKCCIGHTHYYRYMNTVSVNSLKNEEIAKYLNSGGQTEITERIRKIASNFDGSFDEKIQKIFGYIKTFQYQTENKIKIFSKRTADQIIADGYVTGCTDEALIFIVLARALKIPSKYIETIDNEWLKNGGKTIKGHVYVSVFDNEKWRTADQSKRKIDVDIKSDNRTIYKEGLDQWDIGINNFETLVAKFKDFRERIN